MLDTRSESSSDGLRRRSEYQDRGHRGSNFMAMLARNSVFARSAISGLFVRQVTGTLFNTGFQFICTGEAHGFWFNLPEHVIERIGQVTGFIIGLRSTVIEICSSETSFAAMVSLSIGMMAFRKTDAMLKAIATADSTITKARAAVPIA